MLLKLDLYRYEYLEDRTFGKLFINNEYFCHTLEDAVMPQNIKIKNETAIPIGEYEVNITFSSRFKRLMPVLKNVPNYTGIRIHGGNTPDNTSGCVLVAFNRYGNVIQGTAEKKLFLLLNKSKAEMMILAIHNLNFF